MFRRCSSHPIRMPPIWRRLTPPGKTSRSISDPARATAARMALSPVSAAPCVRHPVSQAPQDPPRASEDSPMRDLINYAVFGWYPYLCLIVFLLGLSLIHISEPTRLLSI